MYSFELAEKDAEIAAGQDIIKLLQSDVEALLQVVSDTDSCKSFLQIQLEEEKKLSIKLKKELDISEKSVQRLEEVLNQTEKEIDFSMEGYAKKFCSLKKDYHKLERKLAGSMTRDYYESEKETQQSRCLEDLSSDFSDDSLMENASPASISISRLYLKTEEFEAESENGTLQNLLTDQTAEIRKLKDDIDQKTKLIQEQTETVAKFHSRALKKVSKLETEIQSLNETIQNERIAHREALNTLQINVDNVTAELISSQEELRNNGNTQWTLLSDLGISKQALEKERVA